MKKKLKPKEVIYREIQHKIMNGTWKPMSKIASENELAREFGVARVSAREAIEKMVALDILEKRQGKGTFVKQLDPSISFNSLIPSIVLEIDKNSTVEILELRRALDVGSTKLCAERRDYTDIKKLTNIYNKMVSNINNIDKFAHLDAQFHKAITDGTKNKMYKKLNNILFDLFEYHQEKIAYRKGPPTGALKIHKKILDAIIEKDTQIAAIYMERHLTIALERISKVEKI